MRLRFGGAAVLCALAACGGSDGGTSAPDNVVARVVVTATTANITVGQLVQLQAAALNAAGAQIAAGAFTWASSASSVASVNQAGRVTGVAPGQAMISATVSGVTGSLAITVAPATAPTKDTIFTLPQSFLPSVLPPIAKGTSVTFVFADTIEHNAIFRNRSTNPGSPPDIQNARNQTFVRTFNSAGTFDADCLVHPGMTVRFTVQ